MGPEKQYLKLFFVSEFFLVTSCIDSNIYNHDTPHTALPVIVVKSDDGCKSYLLICA